MGLYGTGGGAVTPPILLDGFLSIAPPFGTLTGVSATAGGAAAEVLYAGAAPFLVAGVIQLNIQIPQNISPGNSSVAVSVGGIAANTVTVAVK